MIVMLVQYDVIFLMILLSTLLFLKRYLYEIIRLVQDAEESNSGSKAP